MMSEYGRKVDRDEVLYAFGLACPVPTVDQINAWIDRYPEFAEDIRAHAAVGRDWAADETEPAEEASAELLARGYSKALSALYSADKKVTPIVPAAVTLHDIASLRKKEVFQLAKEIDIGRSVLAALFNGAMLPPIRRRLIEAVCRALEITIEIFDAAFQCSRQSPRLGQAKAKSMPTLLERRCDDIIRDSETRPERKLYFLEED